MIVPALILAAGDSRRLGRPKQLVQVHNEPLLARVIRIAGAAGAAPVYVVLGGSSQQIQAAVNLSGAKIILNERWMQGVASSIHAGLHAIEQHCSEADGALILACDQPRVDPDHIAQMLAIFAQHDAAFVVASRYAHTLGVPAVFPRAAFPSLYEIQGDRGAHGLLNDSSAKVLHVELSGGEIDIDTPDDLRYLE